MHAALGTLLPHPPASADPADASGSRALAEREALAVGSCVSEFRILRVLGSGGFGIVYLAYDNSLQRNIALKEYLPAMWAGRGAAGRLTVRSRSFAAAFAAGLSSFVNEARLLARFDHPSLVKVHRFWEADGTAYMVMPYYEGVSLRQLRDAMNEPPTEAWLRHLLDSLLGALEVMHDASVFHRDVAPDNILLTPSGIPVLLDFGAARHVLMGQTQVLTAILKPLYAPIEQYAREAEVRQGPWTDIYAVAATMHYALTGHAPATSASRAVHDTQLSLHRREELVARTVGPGYDRRWLEALDWGLAVMPSGRPQSIAQWRQALAGRLSVPVTVGPALAVPLAGRPAVDEPFPATVLHARPAGGPARGRNAWAWAASGLALVAGLWSMQTSSFAPAVAEPPAAAPALASAMPAAAAVQVLAPAASVPMLAVLPAVSAPAEPAAIVAATVATAATSPTRVGAARLVRRARTQVTGSPQQVCAGVGFFSRFGCLRRTCASPKWARHPQCVAEERVG